MSDNLTIHGFQKFFTNTMGEILQDAYDIPLAWLFLGLTIFLVFGSFSIISFDNRKMMQSLQTDFKILRKEVENQRKGTIILSDNFQ